MCLGRLVRRGFLVPVGLALAALSPAAALSQKTAGTLASSPVVTSTRTDERGGGGSRIGHLLLALPQAARQLASAAGHVSHASMRRTLRMCRAVGSGTSRTRPRLPRVACLVEWDVRRHCWLKFVGWLRHGGLDDGVQGDADDGSGEA